MQELFNVFPNLFKGVGVEVAQRFRAATFDIAARETDSGITCKFDTANARAAVLYADYVTAFAFGNIESDGASFSVQPRMGFG